MWARQPLDLRVNNPFEDQETRGARWRAKAYLEAKKEGDEAHLAMVIEEIAKMPESTKSIIRQFIRSAQPKRR